MPQQPTDFNILPGLLVCCGLPMAGIVAGWLIRGRWAELGCWGLVPMGGYIKRWIEEIR